MVGLNLDPSRQPYAPATALTKQVSSADFKNSPAKFIHDDLKTKRPVLLIDQSGHFGYVNREAFDALRNMIAPDCPPVPAKVPLKACATWPPLLGAGGEWATTAGCEPTGGDTSCYTGLLLEPPGYTPFFKAVGKSAWLEYPHDRDKYDEGIVQAGVRTLENFRKVGLTTVTAMAESADEVDAWRWLAEQRESGTRIVSIVTPETATDMAQAIATNTGKMPGVPMPIKPACDPRTSSDCRLPRDLGVSGIKVILDGSTQGCTAALTWFPGYRIPKDGGDCSPREGRSNYPTDKDVDNLRALLKPLWDAGTWRFELHANGNDAVDMAVRMYSWLQNQHRNNHTATVLHATITGNRDDWDRIKALRKETLVEGKMVPYVDLRFSHLIGHVAYWGAVFERQLAGNQAETADPTGWDVEASIPFTLHSDATVSVSNPLWFVRQAVTRETWTYPDGLEAKPHVLGASQRISVLEALRAVTIRSAEEKELDGLLGSIEVGKVADFVVLCADPTDYEPRAPTYGDPTKISDIQVVSTYLAGRLTEPLIGGRAPVVCKSATP